MNRSTPEEIVSALLSSKSRTEAAEKLGVSRRTLYTWTHSAEVAQLYEKKKADLLQAAADIFVQNLARAVEALADIVGSEPRAGDRIQAARALLAFGLDYIELAELERRVSALEEGKTHEL